MKTKILATLGAASFALALTTTASHALLGFEPGENMGLATGTPLPEGVFAIDDEIYGKRDGNPGHTGLNIPEVVWATPYSFYNTRVEFAYAGPFFHSDSYTNSASLPGGHATTLTDSRTRFFNQALGILLPHDFGNGFGGSVWGLVRPASQAFVPHTYADLRAALSYTANGFDITAQFGYTGTFGSHNSIFSNTVNPSIPGFPGGSLPGISDAVNVDFTATKKFDKVEIGFVGFAHTDIEDGLDNANAVGLTGHTGNGFTKAAAVAVGGLVGYDFGRFTLQGMVTREVASRGAPQLLNGVGKETRGFFRIILPLYVAPAAPAPVVARY